MILALEKFVYFLSSFVGGADVDSMCALESPVGLASDEPSYVLAQVNGDLVSVLDIRGARKFVGPEDLGRMSDNFSKALESLARAGSGAQHSFAMGFRSDPEKAAKLVEDIMLPQLQTAQRLGVLDFSMLKARRQRLADLCVDESVYLVLRTHANALQPHERKTQQDERVKINEKFRMNAKGEVNRPKGMSQIPAVPMGALLPKHMAAVASLKGVLVNAIAAQGAQLLATVLYNHEALNVIRRHLTANHVPASWSPKLMGDQDAALGSSAVSRGKDGTVHLPTRISRQMFNTPLVDHFLSSEFSQSGAWWYGSVVLEVMPDNGSEPFHALADRIGRTMPWRVAFEIYPNGQNYRTGERMFAALLGAVGDYNKSIRQGFEHLRTLTNAGVYIGAVRAIFTTWGKTREEVALHLANLTSSIEGWGSAGCSNEIGEPSRAVLASAAGFSSMAPAPYLPAPLRNITEMLPFSRPASVWDRGQIIFTTNEGRPYPVEFGSNQQQYWGTIGFAPTGSGKSFMLNVLNSGLLLAPGAREVPPITLVDVGKSGALVMKWMRSILPENLRDQVLEFSLRNDVDYAVNPHDTQHGFELPLPDDIDFLTAVYGTLAPGCGPEADKFFALIIRLAYEKFGRLSPDSKIWQPSLNLDVQKALDRINFVVTDRTRVWAVVDALYRAGNIDQSISAQRYAMPTMQDITKVASSDTAKNLYGGVPAANAREDIITVFTRNISASLDSYAILSGYTQLNIGAARAVAIDLQEVVSSATTEEGRRRSGLMFLLARRIGARNYFLKWDMIEKLCPPEYRDYQEKRVNRLWETVKFLQYDESHYFSGIESVTRLVQNDLRTGRKFFLITAMFSQLLHDFSKDVVENMYNVFILSLGDTSPDEVQETFGLSNDEMGAISRYCIRPGRLFARFRTNSGMLSQILNLNASAYEQFAFTTQGRDQSLRNELSKLIPYNEALTLLAKRFPSGTAEAYFRQQIIKKGASADDSDEALATVAARQLLQESVEKQTV